MDDVTEVVKEKGLVRNTDLEDLLARIRKEKEEEKEKIQQDSKKLNLIKSIMSVYDFVIFKMGMKQGPISVVEFKAAETELRKLATTKSQEWCRRVRDFLGKDNIWHFYLQEGYFPNKAPSFNDDPETLIYCDHLIENSSDWTVKEAIKHFDSNDGDHRTSCYLPTNITELYEELTTELCIK